jgi:hypothetical protein
MPAKDAGILKSGALSPSFNAAKAGKANRLVNRPGRRYFFMGDTPKNNVIVNNAEMINCLTAAVNLSLN